MNADRPFGIYVHVPYCASRCRYCDFTRIEIDTDIPKAFLDALGLEISMYEGPTDSQTIFLGGGTPSLLSAHDLDQVFHLLYKKFHFDAPEISMEVNPDDVTLEKIYLWKSLGINRVSIGVQSFSDVALCFLGRRHNSAVAVRAVDWIATHFDNWSLDLIYGIPVDDRWESSLEAALSFSPRHISTYALTYVAGTPLGDATIDRLDDDSVLGLYQAAEEILSDYEHYEVSNYAKPGYQCQHNLLYWKNEQHVGFGPGAYSLIGTIRSANQKDVLRYLENPVEKSESLSLTEKELRVETLIQHFRLREGISREAYQTRFKEPLDLVFGPILKQLEERGLIHESEGRICPTRQGFYLNDEIGLALVEACM